MQRGTSSSSVRMASLAVILVPLMKAQATTTVAPQSANAHQPNEERVSEARKQLSDDHAVSQVDGLPVRTDTGHVANASDDRDSDVDAVGLRGTVL